MEKDKSSETVKEVVRHICHVCGSILRSKQSLKDHIESLHPETDVKIQCPHCPKIFRTKRSIITHVAAQHNTFEPFKCEYCPKKYSRFDLLKRHLTSHSNERTYKCQICPKTFKVKHAAIKHMRMVHMNMRKYICEECGADFTCSSHLKRHSNLHLKDKPFKCQFCGKECTQSSNLKTHIMGVHKDLSHLVYEKKDSDRIVLPTITMPSYEDYVKDKSFQKPPKPRKTKEKPIKKKEKKVKKKEKRKVKTQKIDKSFKNNSIKKESPSDSPVLNGNEANKCDIVTRGEIVVEHSNKCSGGVLNIEYVQNVAVKKNDTKTDNMSIEKPEDSHATVTGNIVDIKPELTSAEADPLVLSDSLDSKEIIIKKEYEEDTLCDGSYDEHSGDNLNIEYVKDVAVDKNNPNTNVSCQVKKNTNYEICTSCKKKFKIAANGAQSPDTCNKCNDKFTTKKELTRLYKTNLIDESQCCVTCNKTCRTLWEFHIHIMVFHNTCAKCSQQFNSPKEAFRHYKNECCSACDQMEDPFEECEKHK